MSIEVAYTAEAVATGDGRNGRTKTKDGLVDHGLAAPKEQGGSGDGANPEQLFAAGWAACFHGALRLMAKQDDVDVTDSAVGVKAGIGKDTDDDGMGLAATIEVVLPNVDRAKAEELADKAHGFCPYSKATRGNIDVTVNVVDD